MNIKRSQLVTKGYLPSGSIELQHINSKGRARNTLVKASISLDQQVGQDSDSCRYGDLIKGSDGRDLELGSLEPDPEVEAREIIHGYLFALGFNQGDVTWLETILKLSIAGSEKLYRTLVSDSEW